MITLEQVLAEFAAAELPATKVNGHHEALCPACAGSVTITTQADGKVAIECANGCDRSRIADQLHFRTGAGSALMRQRPAWPEPPAVAAFSGLLGRVVKAIEPHTEADPAALLVQLAVAFGNAIGRGPGFQVEGDFHATNLYAAIVGESSKARKGTSWGRVAQVMRLADPEWTERHVASGLSSGEGLIWQVRDPIVKLVPERKGNPPRPTGEFIEETEDPGVDDKRLLVQEGELARVLKVMQRDGNTLSDTLRNLWDRGDGRGMAKNSPARTTGSLVSIIGHIVFEELRSELRSTELANGFANRFLFVCARRSKLLPNGGSLTDADLAPVARELAGALTFARDLRGQLVRSADAQMLWEACYEQLSQPRPGLLGAVTSRAEAQVLRLSVIYALAAEQRIIDVEHLQAAMALWDYCLHSAEHIWGGQLGDKLADRLLEELWEAGEPGLTRGEMRTRLKRNDLTAEAITRALELLERFGLAHMRRLPTGGRPEERWHAIDGGDLSSDRSVSSGHAMAHA